jgi:hypothetical protein
VNIDEYQYDFHKVITVPMARHCFMNYLQTECSAENLMFITDCENIYQCKTRKQLETHVTNIYNNYVKKGSPHEVNLSGPTVKKIDKEIRSFVVVLDGTVTTAYRIFQPAIKSIMNSLEKDSFARFIRDSSWMEYVLEHHAKSAEEMEKIAVHQSEIEQMLLCSDDMDRGYMIWWDILFGQHMFRDGMRWNLKYSKTQLSYKFARSIDVYQCDVRLFDDEAMLKYGHMSVYKQVITFDKCSVHDLYTTCFSEKYAEIFDLVSFVENYKLVPVEDPADCDEETQKEPIILDEVFQLNSVLYGHNIDLKIPFGSIREAFYCSTNVYLPDQETYYKITKPVPRELVLGNGLKALVPDPSKQLMLAFNWIAFEKVDKDKCRLILVYANNLGGYLDKNLNLGGKWLRKHMGKKMSTRQAKSFAKRMDKALDWFFMLSRPGVQDLGFNFEITKRNTELLEQFEEFRRATASRDGTEELLTPIQTDKSEQSECGTESIGELFNSDTPRQTDRT